MMAVFELRIRVLLSHEVSSKEHKEAQAQEEIEEGETWRERGHIECHHGRQNKIYRNLFPYVHDLRLDDFIKGQ